MTPNVDPKQSLSAVVLDHPECLPVLQRHRIDYCCGGRATVAEASRAQGLPVEQLVAELQAAVDERRRDPSSDPREMATPTLLAHIVDRHHRYLRRTLPYVQGLALKVARVHGAHNPRLVGLGEHVRDLSESLLPHLDDEERELFPALEAGRDRPALREELEAMQVEHREVGQLLGEIRDAAEDYAMPEWACTSYRSLLKELQALEEDVMLHVHLENNVLAPRFAA